MSRLLLALMAAPLQNPRAAERETAVGLTFERPAGWTRQELDTESVKLAPPGPDGERCSVMFLPGQASNLNPAAAHEDMFKSMARGSKIDGPVRRSTIGPWHQTLAKLVTAQRQPAWTALFTSVVDRRLETVMFVAGTEALFEAYRPAVDQLIAGVARPGSTTSSTPGVAPAPAPGGTIVHGLVIPYPSSWTKQVDPAGPVILFPPQLQGVQQYFLSVIPSSGLSGTHWESHRTLVKAVMAQVQWTAEPVTQQYLDAPGPFIRTSVAGRIATGGIQTLELYTAAHDGMIEAVVGINGIDRNVVEPVLRGVTFRDPPKSNERPRIVEAYRRMDQKLYPSRQGGALVAGSLMYERIWLRSDGVADFSTTYVEGYAASPLVLKVDPGLMEGDYGRWKAVGDQIHILRGSGAAPRVYLRENGGLRSGGTWWEPMPRVDDLKLAGRWGIRSPPSETVSPYYDWIEFRADGTFATEGVLKHVASGDATRPKPPERGAGRYQIRDWTIFFTFADGQTWSTDFSTLGSDPSNISSVILRTNAYPRER